MISSIPARLSRAISSAAAVRPKSRLRRRWTPCGEKFGDDAIVKGRGFGTKLERQGPSKVE